MKKVTVRAWLSTLTFLNLALFIAYVYLMYPIWTIINNYLVDATGVNYNWFVTILAISWVLLVVFGVHIVRVFLQKASPSLFSLIGSLLILALWNGLFYVLISETQNQYLKLAFFHLSRNPLVLIFASAVVIGSLFWLLRWKPTFGQAAMSLLNIFVGTLLVISFGMLVTVRSSRWGAPTVKAENYFEVDSTQLPLDDVPRLQPWKIIEMDREYGGDWFVAGDIDGDGEVEIVTAKNQDNYDVHHVTSVSAQKLDGSILWQWGDPTTGKIGKSYDVALQVYDWDGDGNLEVIFSTDTHLVQLDGKTGREKSRMSIPEDASDIIMFLNVSGNERPTDILIKDRYHTLWVYDQQGNFLWTLKDPGGYSLGHLPMAMDMDKDGKDELFAGFNLVESDGSIIWTFHTDVAKVWFGGHKDSINFVKFADDPAEMRIIWTYDDAGGIGMIDGNGQLLWEATGPHYQDVGVGKLYQGNDLQIAVEVHHNARGVVAPIQIFSEEGLHLATLIGPDVNLLDWNGDGLDEMIGGTPPGIFNGQGEPLYILDMPGSSAQGVWTRYGDMNGDGLIDIIVPADDKLYIYINESGLPPNPNLPFGLDQPTGYNQQLWRYVQP